MAEETGAFDVGALITLKTVITVASTNTDPTTITLKVLDPLGTVTTVAQADLTNSATGVWEYDYDTTGGEPGTWAYRFAGTGTAQGAEEATFYLEKSAFA